MTMPETVVAPLLSQLGFAQWAALRNLEGISDEEAAVRPNPDANSINWITGHMITVRQAFLTAFQQPPVMTAESVDAYRRGSKPNGAHPERLGDLRDTLVRSHESLISLISGFDEAALAAKAPFSPGGEANETVGSLLGKIVVHESYHTGQLGFARRLVGKPGAI
jgi:uncharacterized damage-inducible protein DinB